MRSNAEIHAFLRYFLFVPSNLRCPTKIKVITNKYFFRTQSYQILPDKRLPVSFHTKVGKSLHQQKSIALALSAVLSKSRRAIKKNNQYTYKQQERKQLTALNLLCKTSSSTSTLPASRDMSSMLLESRDTGNYYGKLEGKV